MYCSILRFVFALAIALMVGTAAAQIPPQDDGTERYQVLLWLATDGTPESESAFGESVGNHILRTTETVFGGAWSMSLQPAPSSIRAILSDDHTPIDRSALESSIDGLDSFHKVVILGLAWNGNSYEIQAREFDPKANLWNVSQIFRSPSAAEVIPAATRAIVEAFSPVGMIGKPRKDRVVVSFHAGQFAGASSRSEFDVTGPLVPAPGSLLQVVIRRRRRGGSVQKYSYSTVPWTILRVESRDFGDAVCTIYSGRRSPLRIRGVSRTDRLAIAVKPRFAQTILRIHSIDDDEQALPGYQVYSREVNSKTTQYVGQSDWRGEVVLPRDDETPLKLYYVKHGSLLLSRLPIVAGLKRKRSVGLRDDSQRLRAEGAVKGIRDRLVDTLARRQIAAARVSKQLDVSNLDEQRVERAKKQLQELRELPGRNEFIREVQDRQREFFSGDKTTQNRIDRLFRDTRDAITRTLTTELENSSAAQIHKAEDRLRALREYELTKQQPEPTVSLPGKPE